MTRMARADVGDKTAGTWNHRTNQIWDRVQLLVPWFFLAISAALYLFWTAPTQAISFIPDVVTVLGAIILTAGWLYAGHTRPARQTELSAIHAGVYFFGMLAMSLLLMHLDDGFIIFAITGFFHAYILKPWQFGVLGVLATSVVINGSAMNILSAPSVETVVMFGLIVMVQTVAISAGLMIAHFGDREERKRERLVKRLETALEENAALHAQLLTQAKEAGVIEERQRLAREVHDTIAQGLAGIIAQLQAAQRPAARPEQRAECVERSLELARAGLLEARRAVRAIAPPELAAAQLPTAMATAAKAWSERNSIQLHFEVTGQSTPLTPPLEVALYRVLQEALTNIAKHAQAVRTAVTLSYTDHEVLLDVWDDGAGFAPAHATGFGLSSMRQRMRGAGGCLEVDSAPGEGTTVSARVPALGRMTGAE